MSQLTYSSLETHYRLAPPQGYAKSHYFQASPNTCAIRLAQAIARAAPAFFRDIEAPAEWKGMPVNAAHLAHALAQKLGKAQRITTLGIISGQRGIIFFDTLRGYVGSGHISLWDGEKVVDRDDAVASEALFQRSPRVYFWRVS